MSAVATLTALEQEGYAVALEEGRIKVRGDAPPPPKLREEIVERRDALKAALFLADPPAWLTRLFDLYWAGTQTPVRLTIPKGTHMKSQGSPGQQQLDLNDVLPTAEAKAELPYPDNLKGGKSEVFMVSLSIKNIAAAVAESVGIGGLQWERILPEVEEALGAWKDGTA